MPVGFVGVVVGSLLTAAPEQSVQELVDYVRYPNLNSDTKAGSV
jgi:cation/acetate symporter